MNAEYYVRFCFLLKPASKSTPVTLSQLKQQRHSIFIETLSREEEPTSHSSHSKANAHQQLILNIMCFKDDSAVAGCLPLKAGNSPATSGGCIVDCCFHCDAAALWLLTLGRYGGQTVLLYIILIFKRETIRDHRSKALCVYITCITQIYHHIIKQKAVRVQVHW